MCLYSQRHLNLFKKKRQKDEYLRLPVGKTFVQFLLCWGFLPVLTHISVVNSADVLFVLFQMSLSFHVPTMYLKTDFLFGERAFEGIAVA